MSATGTHSFVVTDQDVSAFAAVCYLGVCRIGISLRHFTMCDVGWTWTVRCCRFLAVVAVSFVSAPALAPTLPTRNLDAGRVFVTTRADLVESFYAIVPIPSITIRAYTTMIASVPSSVASRVLVARLVLESVTGIC